MTSFFRHLVTFKKGSAKYSDILTELIADYDLDYGVISKEVGSTGYKHHHAYFKTKSLQNLATAKCLKKANVRGVTRQPVRAWCYVIKQGNYRLVGNTAGARSMHTHAQKWFKTSFQPSATNESRLPQRVSDLPLDELKKRQADHYAKQEWDQFHKYSLVIFERINKV